MNNPTMLDTSAALVLLLAAAVEITFVPSGKE